MLSGNLLQFAKRNDPAILFFQVCHDLFEGLGRGGDMIVRQIGHPMETEHNSPVVRTLFDGIPDKVVGVIILFVYGITGDHHRIAFAIDVGLVVAMPGVTISPCTYDFNNVGAGVISGIGKGHGMGNTVLLASVFDVSDLLFDLFTIQFAQGRMCVGMVADLKSHLGQFTDLAPAHVVFFVFEAFEFTDEEGGSESQFFQQRGDKCTVAGCGIVEGQYDGFLVGFGGRFWG